MLRAIALALALLLSFGTVVTLMTDQSEAAAKKKNKKKKRKKIKKYSRAWWRIYRAKQKRKRALLARKRALKARQARLAAMRAAGVTGIELKKDASGQPVKAVITVAKSRNAKNAVKTAVVETYQPNVLPSGETAPVGWKRNASAASEVQFKLSDNNGAEVGSADLKVVSPAMGPDNDPNPRTKSVGGVSTVALRRTVIDRMMKEQGWVVNDYQKEVGGKKVYVVVAQSQGAGGMQSRIFYFMEAEGRVYSLATSAPVDASEKVARDSEKVLNSLGRASRPVEAAAAATLR